MEKNEQLQQEKREARRKRRKRNQIIAYTTSVALILILAVGIVLGVSKISSIASQKRQEQQEQQDKVEELLGTEESIEVQEPTRETEPETPELTQQQKLDEIVNAGIEVMPLEDKVAGLFIVTPEAITGVSTAVKAGEGTQKALSQYAVGGIVYFKKNMQSQSQLKEMIENTILYSKYPLFIAVEEEGGSVSRLAGAGLVEATDSPLVIAQSGNSENAYLAGTTIGTYLTDYGFNLNLAPVADYNAVESSVVADRAYGSDPQTAAGYVTEMIRGLKEQNISACLKHFPGIGSVTKDPHDGLVSTDRTAEEFRTQDFAVFQAGIEAGADMIMISNISAPELSQDELPCSFSEVVVTDILRGELGFDGVIITDALDMAAISEYYDSGEAAVRALRAGCDMILMPEDFEDAYNDVLQAVKDGSVSEERINDSLRRIYRIKYANKLK